MNALSTWIKRFGKRPGRYWIGQTPEGRESKLPLLIAAQVGYPEKDPHHDHEPRLSEIDREKAAQLLAFFAAESLAYGRGGFFREGLRRDARDALTSLAPGARFFTNGDWPQISGWDSLSAATFDGGVIGFDRELAFIFWVEEED